MESDGCRPRTVVRGLGPRLCSSSDGRSSSWCPVISEGGVHVKNTYQFAMVMATAALSAALLLAPAPVLGQAPPPAQMSDPAGDQAFEANARVLTVFDRQGKVVTTVGERA